jgi:superfamily I DNA/RNA helicase
VAGDGSPYEHPDVQRLLAAMGRAAEDGDAIGPPVVVAERLVTRLLGIVPGPELRQFLNALVRFEAVPAAVEHFARLAEQQFYDPAAEAITLLTIHAAKGLEFPVVFVVGAEEGVLPHARADVEEEQRLFYVAATRARERLEILHTKHRGGQPASLSRFVTDWPASVAERLIDPDMAAQERTARQRSAKRSQGSLFL